MTTPTGRPTPLAHLERETVPDQQFAARLRAELTRTGGVKVASAQPVDLTAWKTSGRVGTRRRLLDLAAVAALLLAMIGGLASTTQHSSAPATPTTIPAPQAALPTVQYGGTAAQDLQFSGPAPQSGSVETVWTLPGGEYASEAVLSGQYVYATETETDGNYAHLTAYRATDGTAVWTQNVDFQAPVIPTNEGVITVFMIEPENFTAAIYRLALLNRDTGEPIWIADQSLSGGQVSVDRETIYVSDTEGALLALDLGSGASRWTYTWVRQPNAALADSVCQQDGDPPTCYERSDLGVWMAVKDGQVYLLDPATYGLAALSAETGNLRWAIDLYPSVNDQDLYPNLLVTDFGPVVQFWALVLTPAGQNGLLLGLDPNSGDLEWTSHVLTQSPLASDGTHIFGSMDITGLLAVGSLSAETGELDWYSNGHGNGSITGYLSESNSIVVVDFGSTGKTYGIDADTRELQWTVTGTSDSCQLQFPLNNEQIGLCAGTGIPTRVVRFASSAEASSVADPPSMPIDVNSDANGGGQIRGLPLTDGMYERLWTQDVGEAWDDPYATAFRYNLYSTMQPDENGDVQLTSQDLATGRILWQQPIPQYVPYVVTSKGVVTLVRDPVDRDLLRIGVFALDGDGSLNLLSTSASFAPPTSSFQLPMIVAGNSIVVSDLAGQVVAVDFKSGFAQVSLTLSQELAPDLSNEINCEPAAYCTPRDVSAPGIVSDGQTLYVISNVTAQLMSVDLGTGEVNWEQSVLDRADAEGFIGGFVVSTAAGPMLSIMTKTGAVNFPQEDLYLLSSADGSTIWQKTGMVGLSAPIPTNRGTFYLGINRTNPDGTPIAEPGDMCCMIAEFSLADGSEIWRQTDDVPRQPIGYLSDWNVLIVALPARSSSSTSIVDGGLEGEIPMPYAGIDATTHEATFTFTPDGTLCSNVIFPVGGSGMVVCKGMDREISVFAPVNP